MGGGDAYRVPSGDRGRGVMLLASPRPIITTTGFADPVYSESATNVNFRAMGCSSSRPRYSQAQDTK